ncbi:acetyl-CoA carboxylase [Lactobacillus halodurans]|uniref:Acetyl-CoA carboxylase n=2 Tax=Companilactobacillus halodurans TaxID=2584183 RepID=A0A5P0ZPW5_9LACO|nr:acetyl-CoA carboxylase [Companilactobacillus halodurans]MQS96575.1 acetyl-CoA carboxylase [Companilactobacillus halodurans]
MNKDFQIIMERIKANFTRKRDTRYWLQIVNDPFDRTFNFFINTQYRKKRMHSVPLHTINVYNLSYLEKIVVQITKKIHLTIVYDGFMGLKWPEQQELIQRRRHRDE